MQRASPGFRRLAVVTAVVTYLLILVGGVVRVTGSGDGCGSSGGWPLCNGTLLPALRATTLIEFSHRWATTLTTALIVALAVSAWLTQRRRRNLVIGSSIAGVLLLLQIALGALVVEFDLPGGIVMIHLANALLLLGVLVYVAVSAGSADPGSVRLATGRAPWQPATPKLTALMAAATYVLALSGALVVETRSSAGCDGWPLCGGGFQLPANQMDVIDTVHRVVAGVVVVGIAVTVVAVLRRHRGDRALRRAGALVLAAVVLQIAAGALVVVLRLPAALQGLHIGLAGLLWASVVMVAVLTRTRQTHTVAETARPAEALRAAAAGMAST